MGSVIEYVQCPNCSSERCDREYYYKTGEDFVSCQECGYYYSFKIRRDENGKFVLKDAAAGINFANLIYDEKCISNPFGTFVIKYERSSQMGTIIDEDSYRELIDKCNGIDKSGVREIYISRFVGGEFQKESLYFADSIESSNQEGIGETGEWPECDLDLD